MSRSGVARKIGYYTEYNRGEIVKEGYTIAFDFGEGNAPLFGYYYETIKDLVRQSSTLPKELTEEEFFIENLERGIIKFSGGVSKYFYLVRPFNLSELEELAKELSLIPRKSISEKEK